MSKKLICLALGVVLFSAFITACETDSNTTNTPPDPTPPPWEHYVGRWGGFNTDTTPGVHSNQYTYDIDLEIKADGSIDYNVTIYYATWQHEQFGGTYNPTWDGSTASWLGETLTFTSETEGRYTKLNHDIEFDQHLNIRINVAPK